MAIQLSISEQLTYCTVRIECRLKQGGTSTGTGFFYRFCDNGNTFIPAIITNKHVIEGAPEGIVFIHLADSEGNPIEGKSYKLVIQNFESSWINHPVDDIDLCVLPITALIKHIEGQSLTPFYVPLDRSLLMLDEDLRSLNAIEDILMIGYPNGIWDTVNNMPIVRRGVTATHPGIDYNGKKELMIDAACFPGSSGSPVLLYNPTYYTDKKGNTNFSPRVKLLGILYAGPQYTASGEIQIIDVPAVQKPISISRIPNNLGLVIKSFVLDDFESMLK